MKRISGISLALLFACGAQAADAQNGTPQQRPAGAPGGPPGAQRPGGAAMMAAQQGGAQMRGDVLDAASGRPVASASITVRAADGSVAGGAVTRADGSFRVEGLRPGRYVVRVSQLGYAPVNTAEIVVAPGATSAEVPTVRLAASAVQLEGVTATAARSEVRMSADRNVFSARDMPAAAGGNSTDVLRNVPAVEVDGDGRPSLRGNQNVAVQINGRAAPMRGDQLGQFLQQLPANMVDRVEVIPNPSAKYDPEGMAGIINIVLKGNAELGLSGGTNLSAGTSDRYNASGNLGYQRGRVTLFGSYGFFGDGRNTSGFNNRTNLGGTSPIDYLNQASNGEGRMRSHTLNTSAELKTSRTGSVATTLMASVRDFGQDTRSEFQRLNSGGTATVRSSNDQRMKSDDLTMDGTVSYRNVIRPRQHELSLEARFNRSAFEQSNAFSIQPLDLVTGAPLGSQPARTRNLTDAVNSEAYAQADLTRMLAGMRVETGYKAQLRQVDNDLDQQRFSYGSGAWEEAGGSNVFKIDELVNAGYGVLTRNAGKVELQGGLRVERTDRSTNRDEDLDAFTDLFPSALAAYNLTDSRQVKASYSRRIQRPQTQMLNSFLFYEDPINRFRGNPLLRPEYTDAFELGLQQSGRLGSLQLTPFYRHTTGAIRRVRTVQGDTTTSSVDNIASSDSYGADANVSLRAGRLTGFVGMNAFHQESDGGTTGAISSSGFGWSTRANATLRLTPRTDLTAFGMYRAPMQTEFGRIGRFAMTNFSIRQKFMRDKANVTLRVQDPFNTMRFTSFADVLDQDLNDPTRTGYQIDTERRFGARGVFLAFGYTFGQTPRLRQPRPQDQPASDPSQPIGAP
jgi:outer membrane receptor protein involved in Fe transport